MLKIFNKKGIMYKTVAFVSPRKENSIYSTRIIDYYFGEKFAKVYKKAHDPDWIKVNEQRDKIGIVYVNDI